MAFSIHSHFYLASRKKERGRERSRAENSGVLWLIPASSLSSPGSNWINLILFLKVSVSKGDLMTHWRQCRSIAHTAGTGRATPSQTWSFFKQPQLCKYPSFAGEKKTQGFRSIETPTLSLHTHTHPTLKTNAYFFLMQQKGRRKSKHIIRRTAVQKKKNHTCQRNRM